LVRPNADFVAVAKKFVCVRIVDMQAVDINRYRFDFDLTLAVLLANADGTIYHRYGGRTHDDPLAWMSRKTLIRVMRATVLEHALHEKSPNDKKAVPRRTVYDIETFRNRMDRKPKRPNCIHCHTIHEAQVRDRMASGLFGKDSIWIWPAPARVGLTLDVSDQALIRTVIKGSVAAKAGLKEGDRLVKVGWQKILTIHDLQWVLQQTPFTGGELGVRYLRAGDSEPRSTTLALAKGFKRTDPLTYSWRPYKWALRPAPGFGGPALTTAQKKALDLDPKKFALRVQYIVDWGDFPQQGRENRRKGLRKGDVVISYAGKDDFATVPHFHSWTRLTKKRGDSVKIVLLRAGRRREIEVTLK
jgi:hypothetical protein